MYHFLLLFEHNIIFVCIDHRLYHNFRYSYTNLYNQIILMLCTRKSKQCEYMLQIQKSPNFIYMSREFGRKHTNRIILCIKLKINLFILFKFTYEILEKIYKLDIFLLNIWTRIIYWLHTSLKNWACLVENKSQIHVLNTTVTSQS